MNEDTYNFKGEIKMDILNRKTNESEYEYGLRIIEAKVDGDVDLDWQDIIELLNLDCHRDSLRKACNVTDFSGVSVSKYYKAKIEELLSEQVQNPDNGMADMLEELEQKKLEIIKERTKLQDQRRNYHSLVRTEARWETLLNMIEQGISELPEMEWTYKCDYIEEETEASLLLSDWHIGSDIHTYHNTFNIDVAKQRINVLKQSVIKYCKAHEVSTLNVNILGDMISGIIHITTRLNNQEDVINQVLICSELLSNLIKDLSEEIPNIYVNYTIGNHGRISPSVKESIDTENFEYFILEFMRLRLTTIPNVTINDNKNDKEIVTYQVFSKTVAIVHGHREKKPYDSVKELSNFLGVKVDIVFMGHFHNFSCKNNVITNGCLSGSDEYANNLRFNNDPSQTLVIHFKNGSQALYEIVFK